MRVALYLASTTTRAAAVASLRDARLGVTAYPDVAMLCAAIAEGPPPDAVVTGLRDAYGRLSPAVVGRLRAQFREVPVVTYDAPAPSLAVHLVEAVRLGLSAAALHGIDDLPTVLRHTVAANPRVADAALALTASRLGHATRPVVSYCLRHAQDAPAVTQVAAALGVTRKTVAARLVAEELPPASALVGWGRVLLAARWLEDAGRSVEGVALALGFDGAPGLHHLLARYTGLRATEVRARGGLAAVLPLFATAMDAGPHGRRRKIQASVLCWLHLTLVHATVMDWDCVFTANSLN